MEQQLKLHIQKGEHSADVLSVKQFPATFGRGGDCTYTILESGISRQHFAIERASGSFFIRDLTSTNGTYVNGKELHEKAVLRDNDCIEAGTCVFQVHLEEGADSISPHPNPHTRVLNKTRLKREHKPEEKAGEASGTSVLEGTKTKLLHSHRALKIIYTVLDQCSQESNLKIYLNRLLESLSYALGADRGAIVFEQTGNKNYTVTFAKVASAIPVPGIVLREVVSKGFSILSSSPREDTRYGYLASPWVHAVKTLICVPLISNKKVFGAIYIDRMSNDNRPFSDEDEDLLKAIGIQIGGYLEKSFLLERLTRTNLSLKETNQKLQHALAELQATQEQVIQQERMRALGEMASGIAHDFNNALTTIAGYAELLLDSPEILEIKGETRKGMESILLAANDAADVVGRLREFYRPRQEESFAGIDLNEIVKNAVLLTQPRWKDQAQAKNIAITIETKLQQIPSLRGNSSSLRQMLINLLFNATDAMPQGGIITVSTFLQNEQAVLMVADTGVGMSEEVKTRCLEPFFSTKKERGSGLGLSMVYGIVQRHQGTLIVTSKEGEGSVFSIQFPLPKGQKRQQERALMPPIVSQKRILFVDDDPAVRDVIAQYLASDGHIVAVANEGGDGLQKFFQEPFDLVITDQAMPNMNGVYMSASIKQVSPQTPIILLTGFGEMMEVTGEKPFSVDMVLKKPCSREALREAIAQVTEDTEITRRK